MKLGMETVSRYFQDSLPFSGQKKLSAGQKGGFPLPHVFGKMLDLISIAQAQVHLDC